MTFNKKHFLTGGELSSKDLHHLLQDAQKFKDTRDAGQWQSQKRLLQDKTIVLVFEKPSLRTRASFTVAVQELGGSVLELTSNVRKKEDPEDTIRVLQGYAHGMMIRTFEHEILHRMVQHAKIPIINGLSDLHHPCQVLADLLTLKQRFGRLEGLKLTYVGDGNNMLHSMLVLCPLVGVDIHFACPESYQPDSEILQQSLKASQNLPGKIKAFKTPAAAVSGVHAVYTDVWTSMGFEAEEQNRLSAFDGYQVNEKLMSLADPKAVVMHCMPINKGQEITEDVVEGPRSVLFQQSENRLHVQKAVFKYLFHDGLGKDPEALWQ
ncbi:MAG: ornithine carbamoyltransferase [Pseudobdellovibrionaceae bacterium]